MEKNQDLNTEEKKQMISRLFNRMMDLEFKIATWGFSNSQSNPGAMMDLRDMKKELDKIKTVLGLK